MHRPFFLLFFLLTLMPAASADESALTTIILVRHAEKTTNAADPKDPALSDAGSARAERLAALLRNEPIVAVFASQYQRTQLTAAPTAREHKLPVRLLWAGKRDAQQVAAEFKSRALREYQGRTVLIVGHSNTVPALASALSGNDVAPITEDEFDRVIRIRFSKNNKVQIEISRY